MAFSPIITRLYGPEAYGLQGIFMTVVGFGCTVAALSYPIAIVLPRSDSEAIGIAKLSLVVGVAMTTLMTFGLIWFGPEILKLLNAEAIKDLVYLMPVVIFLSVIGTVVGQWLIRKKAFALTAKTGVLTTLVVSTTKTAFGFFHPSAMILIVTNALSTLVNMVLIIFQAGRSTVDIKPIIRSFDPGISILELAQRHRDFALLRTPQNLINGFSQTLPAMLLASYSGPTAVGYYALALSVLAMPVTLIGGSVMQVFYPRINEAIHNKEDARQLIIKATLGMALTGAVPFIAIILAGPWLFSLVFGADWAKSGQYAQWLSAWIFFQYINKPAVSAIPALRLQGGLLIYEIFSTGTKVLALFIGFSLFQDDIYAIAIFSIFGIIAYLWLILWVIYRSKEHVHPTVHE
jgi:O-antigen/teichoic acid export membrane protein